MKKIIMLLIVLIGSLSYLNAKDITNSISGKLINKKLESNTLIIFRAYKINDIIENKVPACSDTALVDDKGVFNTSFTAPGTEFYLEIEILNAGVRILDFNDELTKIRLYSSHGDSLSVKINFDYHWVAFAGKGAEKMNCQYLINATKLPNSLGGLVTNAVLLKHEPQSIIWHRMAKELLSMKFAVLRTYQRVLSSGDYERIKADMIGRVKYEFLNRLMPNGGITKKRILEAGMFLEINRQNKESLSCVDPQREQSLCLIQIILKQAQIQYQNEKHKQQTTKPYTDWMIDYIAKNYDGSVRDDLYLAYFLEHLVYYPKVLNAALPKVIKQMKNIDLIKVIKTEAEKFVPKEKAFPFVFEDESGKKILASDFKNKIVLMDFWFNGCHGCTQIPPKIKIIMERLKHRSDIVYLSISVDSTKKLWLDGLKNGQYTVTGQLHVFTGGGGRMLHPFLEHYGIKSFPHLTLIGKNGIILSSNADPRRDDGAEIIKMIENEQ